MRPFPRAAASDGSCGHPGKSGVESKRNVRIPGKVDVETLTFLLKMGQTGPTWAKTGKNVPGKLSLTYR